MEVWMGRVCTCVLCCILLSTIGLIASSRSSFILNVILRVVAGYTAFLMPQQDLSRIVLKMLILRVPFPKVGRMVWC